MEEEILINTLYTGDYTNKNIGHEIINLMKSKNGKVYIYVTPYGFYSEKHNVNTILLTRGVGKNLTEVIAIIKNPELLYKEKIMPKQTPSFSCKKSYFQNNEKDKNVFQKFKNLCMTKDEQYQQWEQDYTTWEKKQVDNIENGKDHEKEFIISDKTLNLSDIAEFNFPNFKVEKALYDYNEWKDKFKEWIKTHSSQHIEQVKKIYDDDIKYNDVYLYKILSKNFYNNKTLHFTFMAEPENIFKPKIPTFLKTLSYEKGKVAEYIEKDEGTQTITYTFKNIEFRPQSCYSFITQKQNEAFKNIFDEIIDCNNISSYNFNEDTETTTHNNSFLDILGMQYDEVCYSNMFAYFFTKYPQLFKKFAKEVLKIRNICIDKTFEVRREVGRIDLLIVTDKDVIVIENKIKAKIHGENYDKENNEYTNQLIKYYNETENNSDFIGKEKHYCLFRPKYNQFNIKINPNEIIAKYKDKINDNENDLRDKIVTLNKDIIAKYEQHSIDFEQIYNFLKEENTSDIYFNEFLNALEKHSRKYDNTIEEDMKYKFSIAIQNASE